MSAWTGNNKNIWFHWQDGWFFHRLPDGAVRIVKRETAKEDSPIVVEAKIPAAQWASIVCSVSQFGDIGGIYQMILAFHGEPIGLSGVEPPESGQDSGNASPELI